MKIIRKTKIKQPQKVYDFTVGDAHHYITSNGIVTHNSYVPTKEMGGGSGLKYAASTIVYLSKKKVKDTDNQVIGNIIHCKLYKSRLTKENLIVDVLVNYEKGLDPHYGLLDIALKYGIFNKVSTRIELPDGTKAFEKTINEDPQKFFTKEVMDKLEEVVSKEFKYGN